MTKVELFEKERATGYDTFVETWIPNYHAFINALPGLLRETAVKSLLIAGCGTGNELEKFIAAPEIWDITGIDPSPDMIRQAREKLRDVPRIELIEGLVNELSPDRKYGAATLLLVLHFLQDDGGKLNLLQDISDRLLPGAPLVLLDITGNEEQLQENLNILRLLLPAGLDEEKVNERLRRIQQELFAVSEERLATLCQAAGFTAPLRFFQSAIYMGWLMYKRVN